MDPGGQINQLADFSCVLVSSILGYETLSLLVSLSLASHSDFDVGENQNDTKSAGLFLENHPLGDKSCRCSSFCLLHSLSLSISLLLSLLLLRVHVCIIVFQMISFLFFFSLSLFIYSPVPCC